MHNRQRKHLLQNNAPDIITQIKILKAKPHNKGDWLAAMVGWMDWLGSNWSHRLAARERVIRVSGHPISIGMPPYGTKQPMFHIWTTSVYGLQTTRVLRISWWSQTLRNALKESQKVMAVYCNRLSLKENIYNLHTHTRGCQIVPLP